MKNRLRLHIHCALFILGCFFVSKLHAQLNTSITISGPTLICQYSCATYVATVTPGSTQNDQVIWTVNGLSVPITTTGNTLILCPAEFNMPPGQAIIMATLFGPNGGVATDTLDIYITPIQPLIIKSSNIAPCNESDSTTCEKGCPGATVTYSVLPDIPAGQSAINWHVAGASSWVINPPSGGNPSNGSSITVTWGPTGAGSVSAFTDGIFGCAGEASICVTIIAAPQAVFTTNPPQTAAANLTVCRNQTVYFQNQSSVAAQDEWR